MNRIEDILRRYRIAKKTRDNHPGTHSYQYYTTRMVKLAHEYNKKKKWYQKKLIPKP